MAALFLPAPLSDSQVVGRIIVVQHPGVVRAYCPLHSTLPSVILVVPNIHYAVPDNGGRFQIGGVPAGCDRLSLWTEQHGVVDREVSLAAGQVMRADLTPDPTR
ncbi:MAG: hypothetical protein WEF50_07575 [Myxococcota bacterium]